MRVAMTSLHTSPLEVPGRGDAGGLNVQVRALAQGLAKAGHQVTVFTRRTSAHQPESVRLAPGCQVRTLPVGPPEPVAKEDLIGLLAQFGEALADAGSYDVWHSHYWMSAAATERAHQRIGGGPHVVNLHTVAAEKAAQRSDGEPAEPDIRHRVEQQLVHNAHFVAGSAFERRLLLEHYRAPSERIDVIAPGVDTELFRPDKAATSPVPADVPYLLTIGRIQPLKGQDLALDAFLDFSRAHPEHQLRFVIAGEPTPGHEEFAAALRHRAEQSPLGDRVHFLPAQCRLSTASLLAGAVLTMVPSRSETFGLVALESAAAGTPVLAADVGGLSDSVVDGVSGVLLPDREVSTWSAALAKLFADSDRLDDLSLSARTYALARGWPRYVQQIVELYRRLIDDSAQVGR